MIDVDTFGSPGWWLQRTFNMLASRPRRCRLQLMWNYLHGNPPMPEGAEGARAAFQVFQRKARTNLAELITSAMTERMILTGIRTAVDSDATGDAEMGALWERAGMGIVTADTHDNMLGLSEGFVIVGGMDQEIGAPQVTCEDPRYMVADLDPADPRKLRACLKVLHDDTDGEDRAYLFMPGGYVFVATRKSGSMSEISSGMYGYGSGSLAGINPNNLYIAAERLAPIPHFDPRAWSWDEKRSGTLRHGRMPVVHFLNKYSMGEFEAHVDLLDRINHGILQRMIIAVMQAFRQRAIKGLPTHYPDDHPTMAGEEIDYNEIFSADPAALWQLPIGADIWESSINDLRPILNATKDDVEQLGSVTRTPLYMLHPGGENQSAEGASLAREGLVFKVEDRIERVKPQWRKVAALVALHAGMPERADLSKLSTIWAPVQRLSLAERSQAVAQLKEVLPRRTLYITVIGMTPQEADRAMAELADEQVLAAQMQAALAAGAAAAAAAGPAGAQQPGIEAPALPAAAPGQAGQLALPAVPEPAVPVAVS